MYINFRSLNLHRSLSIVEYYPRFTKCSINRVINGNISNSTNLNNRRLQFFVTSISRSSQVKDNHVQAYLRKRERPSESETYVHQGLSSYNKLKDCSKDLEVNLDSISFELNYKDHSNKFLLTSNGYSSQSLFPDGHIDLSLTNSHLYFDHIKEINLVNDEDSFLNRKLVPATLVSHEKYFKYKLNNNTIEYAQRIFDSNVNEFIMNLDGNQCLSLVESLFLLDTTVSYKDLCKILEKGLNYLGDLSVNRLVKLAICVRGYLDNDNSYLKHFLLRIGCCLENKLVDLDNYSQQELIDNILPLSIMQFTHHPVYWSVVSNYSVLNKMTDGFENLDPNYQGKLLVILSSLESCPDVSNKYYKVYEELIHSLTKTMQVVDYKVILNMMNMPVLFHSFEMFREQLYNQLKLRWKEFPVNTVAFIYLNNKDDIPKEHGEYILHRLGFHLNGIMPKYIPELFCSYLNDGDIKLNSLKMFSDSITSNIDLLTPKNISNILMYLSINLRSKVDFYSNIMDRFRKLKKEKAITNQELLDVVLSMSLVGIQDQSVWSDVDLNTVVVQLPRNILVYLGYSFLITDMNDNMVWSVLLDRILNENKNVTPETYEVLRAAQILDYIPHDYTNNRLHNCIKGCKFPFHARQSKQRYISNVPYEVIFESLRIKYLKDYIIDDLYEAPYYLPEHKYIIVPLQNTVLHPTSGSMAGDLLLRSKVWRKSNYKHFFFSEQKWNRFYKEDSGESFWDIDGMALSFSKITKLNELYNKKDKKVNYLSLRSSRRATKVLKSYKPTGDNIERVRMLQKILVENNQNNQTN